MVCPNEMKQYQPLYLKYRPQKLSEVIGQDVVTKTLTNAIFYNKIVHAYLFCGPRGTGKTSTARILAKSLNCESGITAEPCNKCTSCQSITIGNSLDVIEIDAASHRKVEDAEDLINRVNLGTYGSRFKVYIIDEVHMLTDHAFNALLKTLEEPPKNVIFILATTEEYKVIPTIISRCQKLDFKAISHNELKQRIKDIADNEKINIDETIINFISKRSQGCLRDAISFLDQISVLQVENKPIEPKEVFELFGTVDRTTLFRLIESVLNFDRKNSVDLAEELIKSGKDISELFKSLLELIIDLAKAKIDPEYKKTLSLELANDLQVVDKVKKDHLLKIIDRLHDAQSKLRFALSQELEFLVEIMSMLDEDFLVSMADLKERVERLEKNEPAKGQTGKSANWRTGELANQPAPTRVERGERAGESANQRDSVTANEPQENETTGPNDLTTTWTKILKSIDSNPTRTLLTQSDSYLLALNSELLEIGIGKDMFLPRLEKDDKKKEVILRAAKLASSLEPKIIKFRVLPRQKEQEEVTSNEPQAANHNSSSDNDFTSAIKDLLGAKEI